MKSHEPEEITNTGMGVQDGLREPDTSRDEEGNLNTAGGEDWNDLVDVRVRPCEHQATSIYVLVTLIL
jgi:hypothetical protein